MLRIVSVNIEGRKHLESVADFLKTEMPDVLCLQEVYEVDLPQFEEIVGGTATFAPMHKRDGNLREGVALISRFSYEATFEQYAGKESEELPIYDNTTFQSGVESQRYNLLTAHIQGSDGSYTIATTHLPVTEGGHVTDYQIEAIKNLITCLEKIGEFVVLGDMNAPRGQQSFSLLAERYRDNIPLHYESSLDPVLHRAPLTQKKDKMVDGCFSTPAYTIKQTRFQCGISDHCAICVEVTKSS